MQNEIEQLIAEYPPEYCQLIEAAYGENWMGDGGDAAIDDVFSGVDIQGKRILDLGAGLGGAAFRMAQEHGANVIGLEINPWLVAEAKRRISDAIKNKVDFVLYDDVAHLPFDDASFDIFFSHGTLVHVSDKKTLFQEVHRILKPDAEVYIYDWLCQANGQWGAAIQTMADNENLTLIPTTEADYQQLLHETGFTDVEFVDKNATYASYNEQIVEYLNTPERKQFFAQHFDEATRIDLAEGHQLIAKSMQAHEVLARYIHAQKSL